MKQIGVTHSEARMWLREMAGMGLHRINTIMDGINLLPTKLKSQTTTQAKSLIESPKCRHAHPQRRTHVFYASLQIRLCSPIRFNERKSYNQGTQGKTYVGQLFT